MAVIPDMATELDQANAAFTTDPARAEGLYRGILGRKAGQLKNLQNVCVLQSLIMYSEITDDEDGLRDQESALIKLGALYRDQK